MRVKVNPRCNGQHFEALIARLRAEEDLSESEMASLLNLEDNDRIRALFREARDMRCKYFGNRIFMYGFIRRHDM